MNWKAELELLKEKQKDDIYGNMICDDVEEVMTLISQQGHSGSSYAFLSSILTKLLNEKPLFPITDNPKEWGTSIDEFQNNRVTSIFKEPDGSIMDLNRTIYVDTYANKNITCHYSKASEVVDKMFPIILPYMPEDKPYYVYGKDMYLDNEGNDKTLEHRGTSNYSVLEFILTPDNKKIELNLIIDER